MLFLFQCRTLVGFSLREMKHLRKKWSKERRRRNFFATIRSSASCTRHSSLISLHWKWLACVVQLLLYALAQSSSSSVMLIAGNDQALLLLQLEKLLFTIFRRVLINWHLNLYAFRRRDFSVAIKMQPTNEIRPNNRCKTFKIHSFSSGSE